MKKQISNNGDYAVYAELAELETHKNIYSLKFTTTLASSKNPSDQQEKFTMFLSKTELENLLDVLKG
jgi:hypothetical protein